VNHDLFEVWLVVGLYIVLFIGMLQVLAIRSARMATRSSDTWPLLVLLHLLLAFIQRMMLVQLSPLHYPHTCLLVAQALAMVLRDSSLLCSFPHDIAVRTVMGEPSLCDSASLPA